jgi:hypothetical protein
MTPFAAGASLCKTVLYVSCAMNSLRGSCNYFEAHLLILVDYHKVPVSRLMKFIQGAELLME